MNRRGKRGRGRRGVQGSCRGVRGRGGVRGRCRGVRGRGLGMPGRGGNGKRDGNPEWKSLTDEFVNPNNIKQFLEFVGASREATVPVRGGSRVQLMQRKLHDLLKTKIL